MNVCFNTLTNPIVASFEQNFLRPLSIRTNKILRIAILAFACLAAYFIYHRYRQYYLLDGQGRKIVKNGVEIGVFKDGWLNGEGEIRYNDGRIAKGTFYKSCLEGQGTMTYPDGKVEEGIFINNVLRQGKRTYRDGKNEEVGRPPVQPEKA
jgi:hypothetical protein